MATPTCTATPVAVLVEDHPVGVARGGHERLGFSVRADPKNMAPGTSRSTWRSPRPHDRRRHLHDVVRPTTSAATPEAQRVNAASFTVTG